MKIIDNTSLLLGDDLKATVGRGARLKIAASCFSIYAFEALKSELSRVESLQFIFTAPTFVPMDVTDRLRKERREFFIPKTARERGLAAIIAGAGGAAHLPGMLAAKTSVPVLGVPVPSKHLQGLDQKLA